MRPVERALPEVDTTSMKVLVDAYWGSGGWLETPAEPPAPSLHRAKKDGVMFSPQLIAHDDVVQRCKELAQQTSLLATCNGFLASLTTGRVDLRSAVGSFAVALAMPLHKFAGRGNQSACAICGNRNRDPEAEDLNILSLERLMWGGIRRLDPL